MALFACGCGRGTVRVPSKDVKPIRVGGKNGETIYPKVAIKCSHCCRDEQAAKARPVVRP